MRRFARRRLLAAVAGASLLAAAGTGAREPAVESASLPALRLLAIDPEAQRAVIAVDTAVAAVVVLGEKIEELPGYRLRRVLPDRVVLEKSATAGAEPTSVWVHALRPGEERSMVQELLASPPPGTLDIRPQVTAGRPAAEGESSHRGAANDPRGEVVTVKPPPDAPEPPP